MIPILFAPTATNFTTNGIGRLSDAVSCTVHEARNGEFELEMEYPVDGAHYAAIVHSAIIVAKPSARRSNQAFRITVLRAESDKCAEWIQKQRGGGLSFHAYSRFHKQF